MSMFIALPEDVKAGIMAVVLAVVSFVFAKLIALVPFLKFLDEFRAPLALAIGASLIGWLENVLPTGFDQPVILALQFILAVLALFGVGTVLKAKGVKGFK